MELGPRLRDFGRLLGLLHGREDVGACQPFKPKGRRNRSAASAFGIDKARFSYVASGGKATFTGHQTPENRSIMSVALDYLFAVYQVHLLGLCLFLEVGPPKTSGFLAASLWTPIQLILHVWTSSCTQNVKPAGLLGYSRPIHYTQFRSGRTSTIRSKQHQRSCAKALKPNEAGGQNKLVIISCIPIQRRQAQV